MLPLIGRRLIQLLPTLFFVSVLIFSLQKLLPGDPALVMAGEENDPEVIAEIRRQVRSRCSPRHVPDEVVRIDAVPRTLSGKKLEVPVKKILMGAEPDKAASRDSLANPAALDWFVEFGQRAGA